MLEASLNLSFAKQVGQPSFRRIVPRDNVRASIAVWFWAHNVIPHTCPRFYVSRFSIAAEICLTASMSLAITRHPTTSHISLSFIFKPGRLRFPTMVSILLSLPTTTARESIEYEISLSVSGASRNTSLWASLHSSTTDLANDASSPKGFTHFARNSPAFFA